MKRRLLSAFLAVMMVLTMAPVAFAADTSVGSYDELVKAISSASDGDTITVSGTIAVEKPLTVTKTVTLTGGVLEAANDFAVPSDKLSECSLISMRTAGKTLTLKDIKLDAKQKTLVVFSDAGKVVVDGAIITGGKTGSYVAGVYMTSASQFEMNSGSITDNEVGDAYKNDKYTQYAADLWIGANANGALTAINGGTVGNVFVNSNAWSASNPGGFTMTGGNVKNLYVEYDAGYGAAYTYQGGTIENLYISTTDGNGKSVKVTPVVGMAYVGGQTSEDATSPVAKVGDTGYATLAAAVAAAKDGGTIELLKNVEETLRLKQGEDITLNLNGHTLSAEQTTVGVVHGKLVVNGPGTIKENKPNFGAIIAYGSVSQNDTNYTEVTVNKNVTLEGWAPVFIDQKNGKAYGVSVNLNDVTLNAKNDTSNAVGSGVYVNGQITDAVNSPVINLDSITIASTGHGMYLAGYATTTVNGGSVSGSETGIEIRAGKLTVNGATVTGNGIPTSVTPNGNGSTSVGAGIAVAQHTTELPIDVTISDGMISGYTGLLESNPQNNPAASIARVNINVAGGKFAAINGGKNAVSSDDKRVIISGGVFAQKFDNSYCATGLTVIDSKDTTYKYTVGTVEVKDENEIKTDTQKGATQATLGDKIAAGDKTAATAVGTSVTPTKLTDTTPITADDKAQALTELVKKNKVKLTDDGKIPAGTTVTVVKETYLDVTVTAYDTKSNTVSMDITPKYNLIATTDKDNRTDANSVTLETKPLTVSEATKVSVTIPAFANKKVYIDHANGKNLYVATADENGKIEFTTNGFSPFTFTLSNPNVVAEVNGNAYTSFQDAVNAVANGGTIEIVGGNKNYTATISGSSKTFTVKNTLDSDITVKVNNDSKTVGKNNGTQSFTYTKPSSGGSSGGSSSGKTTYKVTTSAVNNGGVNASPSSAEKGATITITLSPDKGYKLDKLTVTDGSGKTVSTVKKSDTVYTFTMPASAVKVGVSYVKATETPSETKFNDVSANDWFASAVDYVTGKGMMNGTADNTFSPKANTTRGMVVTVLYRLENQPSTSAASFTDVASGAYYANAVAWANANGIVSGYGSGKFGPNDKVTREQLAAILYRYAQYKKYDVSVGEDTNILSYDDAQSISTYAIPAIQWACGAGVVTGKSGSKLDPKGNATRAEVAAMLMRFCENVK